MNPTCISGRKTLRNQQLLLVVVFISCFFSVGGQTSIDSLRSSFEQESEDSLKVVYEMNLAREIHRKEHDEQEEYTYAQDAVQRALDLGDTLLYARALDNLGLLYRYHQHYDEALPLHAKAFNLVKAREVDPVYKMIFANNAGVAGRYHQAYDSAMFYYMAALRIAEQEDNLRNIAIASNGIGNTLGNISGREEEALEYFQRSLAAEKERENTLGVAMNYLSISDYYIEKEEYQTAREYLDELVRINRERNDLYGLAITYEFYGKSYLEEGKNPEKATLYFEDALGRFEDLQDRHKQAEILLSLGDMQQQQKKLDVAEDYYRRSLELSHELDLQGLIMSNSLRLADILEATNQPVSALRYFRQGKAYEDSIKLSEQKVEIAALIRQYDTEQKENQIQLLQKDRALQQTLLENQERKLEQRRTMMLFMGTGFLFILLLVLFQYRHSRIKKKTRARIQEEEKKKMKAIYERNLARAEILVTRLRINPHFLFNSLNAITYLIQSEQNAKAMKYLVVFSRYTRMVLETSQKHVVPLSEELKLTRYYLTLEENRFDNDFSYQITGDDLYNVEEIFIPPLLLQPFIENAIWHGLLPSKCREKKLLLKLVPMGNDIKIIIDDNGVGRKKQKREGVGDDHNSMGMKIVEERIELYNKSYSASLTCEIIDKKDEEDRPQGTRIILVLKQEKQLREVGT